MARTPHQALGALLLLFGLASGTLAGAQDGDPTGLPTLADVAARIESLNSSPDLADDERTTLLEGWNEVRTMLERAQDERARAADFVRRGESAPEDLEVARTATERPDLPPHPGADADLAALTSARTKLELALSRATSEVSRLEQRIEDRDARRPTLSEERSKAVAELEAQQGSTDTEAVGPRFESLRRARRSARAEELAARITSLEADLDGFDARGEVLAQQLLAAEALELAARDALQQLDGRVQGERERQAAETTERTREAADAAENSHPVLRAIAAANAALSSQQSALVGEAGRLQEEVEEAARQLKDIQSRRKATERRDELGAGTQRVGTILREERALLPTVRQLEQDLGAAARRANELRFEEVDLGETLGRLETPEQELADLVVASEGAPRLSPTEEQRALELLDEQRALAVEVRTDLKRASDRQDELEELRRQRLDEVRSFRKFIDERVLWVRSTVPVWRAQPANLFSALREFLDPERGSKVLSDLLTALVSNPLWAIVYPLLVLGLFRVRMTLRRGGSTKEEAGRTLAIGPTFAALARDAVMAALWPIVVAVPAYLLSLTPRTGQSGPWPEATGALAIVPVMYTLSFVRRLARTSGTGDVYFAWGEANLRLVRRTLLWAGPLYVVATFVATTVHTSGFQPWNDTLGRAAFIVAMGAAFFALRRLLGSHGLSTPPRYRDEESWLSRLRPLWLLAGAGGALALILASLLGFHYTARQLWPLFELSIALFVVVLVVQAAAFRWLLLARRRIQLEQARARRDGDTEDSEEEEDEFPDLRSLGLELRHAVRAAAGILTLLGLYWIWRSEVPALGALDKFALYPFGLQHDPDSGWPDDRFVFTPASLGIVLLAIFATRAVATRLPGLLDFLLLDRTGLSAAERYALRSVTQYLVVGVGIMVALAQVGVTWSQLQFLAAAVSVGLGFGLQEIFANFVSGLILLFERPIRVGDLVTVAGTEGRVTNIRIRATTILDFDNRELIVPNKEFVTGSLVNWTLSDPITRVVIPVGVAYGSDVELVKRLLMQAATSVRVVLREPPPQTLFRRFGDSSLDFELRIYLGDRNDWVEAVDRLHAAIDRSFRESGVEIPFPQRDLHLRDAAGLTVETIAGAR